MVIVASSLSIFDLIGLERGTRNGQRIGAESGSSRSVDGAAAAKRWPSPADGASTLDANSPVACLALLLLLRLASHLARRNPIERVDSVIVLAIRDTPPLFLSLCPSFITPISLVVLVKICHSFDAYFLF